MARILHRHQMSRLADCDPLTGTLVRASGATMTGYETRLVRRTGAPEVLRDGKGTTAVGFLAYAAAYFTAHGIERVITDNAFAYRNSIAFKQAVADLRAPSASSNLTISGPMAKPNAPTAPGKPNGPNARSSAAPTASKSSSTTKLNGSTLASKPRP
ncbi:hypothetical protein [Arthrobacter sp. CAL618]|uniref:hypothetical protein n=1 Tax=Arthrobacter sp. CAL618 TaxID=1055770 RepID=UPI000466CD3B|nr:hypothetical protein [Arthrobacter sp. CAL618]